MIKVPMIDLNLDKSKNSEAETATKYILANTELIPVEANNQVLPQTVWLTELGKQLLKAASDGDVDEIRTLMSKGAPFTADWLGTSPLHLAAQNNHLEVCLILLRAGISKDARTKVDRTPLHMAAYEGHYEIVECLLTHGADVNCRDLLGMTPLHWAVQNGNFEVVSLLIHYGAHLHVTNKFDLSPLDIAMQIQRHDIADSISMALRQPAAAAETLQMEMNSADSSNDSGLEPTTETQLSENESPIPIETILLEDMENDQTTASSKRYLSNSSKETDESIDNLQSETENNEESPEAFDAEQEDFSESLRLLQQHGITMLPTDETSIFTSVMNSGHQVVLTEIGKEMLNSTKPAERPAQVATAATKVQKPKANIVPIKAKKIITVTPEEFLAMTVNLNSQGAVLQKVNDRFNMCTRPPVKRIVMKKNKLLPLTIKNNSIKVKKSLYTMSDIENLLIQLVELRAEVGLYKKQTEEYKKEIEGYKEKIEEYKNKIVMKEAEIEKYKQVPQ